MSKKVKITFSIFIIGFTLFYQVFTVSYRLNDITFQVLSGDNIKLVSKRLYNEKLISNWEIFWIYWRFYSLFSNNLEDLKKGEFLITKDMTNYQIMKKLCSNDYYFKSITFPEGMTAYEMLEIVEKSDLSGDIKEKVEEGYLMPETYYYTLSDTKNSLIKRMKESMNDFLDKAWLSNKNKEIKNKKELLILASIIEKESGIESERGIVSSVYSNRLRIGMKLQADPTVIYQVTDGRENFGRKISKKDLLSKGRYNTYQMYGLPSGAIACPSKESILAAGNPKETKYLYFVAKNDGSSGHNFSENYEDHRNNVSEYRGSLSSSEKDLDIED